MKLKIFLTVFIIATSIVAGIFFGTIVMNLLKDVFVSLIAAAFGSIVVMLLSLNLFERWI